MREQSLTVDRLDIERARRSIGRTTNQADIAFVEPVRRAAGKQQPLTAAQHGDELQSLDRRKIERPPPRRLQPGLAPHPRTEHLKDV